MLIREKLLRHMARSTRIGLILFGHGVDERPVNDFVSNVHIPLHEFHQSIDLYERLGFDFVSMSEVLELARTGFARPRPWIHLTFDDGYRNNLTVLAPYLSSRGIPWTVFVSTGHIERRRPFGTFVVRCAMMHAPGELMLPGMTEPLSPQATAQERIDAYRRLRLKSLDSSTQLEVVERATAALSDAQWQELDHLYAAESVLSMAELQELARQPLVHIGSHNHNHIVLNGRVTAEEVSWEMRTSRAWLRQNLGISPVTYCYPNGQRDDFSATTGRICRDAGYQAAFTTISEPVRRDSEPYEIPRKALSPTFARARRSVTKVICRAYASSVLRFSNAPGERRVA